MPRLDLVAAYCAVCHDQNMPALVSDRGELVPPGLKNLTWALTAQGLALSTVMNATGANASIAAVNFQPNPVLDASRPTSRVLVGWAISPQGGPAAPPAPQAVVVANLGGSNVTVAMADALSCAEAKFDSTFAQSEVAVQQQNMTAAHLGHIHDTVAFPSAVELPLFSISVLRCTG